MPPAQVYTISQVTAYIKSLFVSDLLMGDVWLSGEVSGFTQASSGHCYFTLKDGGAVLKAVIWRTQAARLTLPRNGDQVIVHGSISVYEAGRQYQLYVDHLEPAGMGRLWLEFERLKARLAAEGLFDEARKRPIPALPRRLGVVTSATGAALRDILRTLAVRYPLVDVILAPAPVQGADAPPGIVAGPGRRARPGGGPGGGARTGPGRDRADPARREEGPAVVPGGGAPRGPAGAARGRRGPGALRPRRRGRGVRGAAHAREGAHRGAGPDGRGHGGVRALEADDPGGDPAAALDRLSRLLVAPLALPPEVKRVLVSPEGPLSYVPFAALVPEREIAHVASGSTYAELTGQRSLRGEKVLALALRLVADQYRA